MPADLDAEITSPIGTNGEEVEPTVHATPAGSFVVLTDGSVDVRFRTGGRHSFVRPDAELIGMPRFVDAG